MNHRDMQPVRPERDDRTVEIQQAHARGAELSQRLAGPGTYHAVMQLAFYIDADSESAAGDFALRVLEKAEDGAYRAADMADSDIDGTFQVTRVCECDAQAAPVLVGVPAGAARPSLLALRIEHVRDELRREHERGLGMVGDLPVVVRLGVLVQELDECLRLARSER